MSKNETLQSPRQFIPYWFGQKKLKVAGNLIITDLNEVQPKKLVFDIMWLDYVEHIRHFSLENNDKKAPKKFPEKDLEKAFSEFLAYQQKAALDDVRRKLKCTGENLDELRLLLKAMTGRCDDLELGVLSHLLWQVKRKLFNLKAKDHMMIIFRGKQGGGKTEAIKILFSVLEPWFKNASLKELTDDRWKHFFSNTYVAFCDELQYAEFADMDSLKGIISAEKVEARALGTNTYDNIRQNSTFVGASNRPVAELIKDSTGMRRFFELLTLDKMDWNTVNSIDVTKLWQGIDENRESPYTRPFKAEIEVLQNELTASDSEADFLSEFGLIAEDSPTPRTYFLTNAQLYSSYNEWANRNGERPKAGSAFHRKIKGMGLRAFADKQGNPATRGYWITGAIKDALENYRQGNSFCLEKFLAERPAKKASA
jgi:hypothetical protein